MKGHLVNKKQSQFGSGHLAIVIILVLALLGALGYVYWKNYTNNNDAGKSTSQKTTKELAVGDFAYNVKDGYFGTTQIEGYASVSQIYGGYAEEIYGENAHEYIPSDYVSFVVTKKPNDTFASLFNESSDGTGKSFMTDDSIGLGCVSDNSIYYFSKSDEDGKKLYNVSKDDSSLILSSKKESPVILQVTKKKYTGGSEMPGCTSFLTSYSVVQ